MSKALRAAQSHLDAAEGRLQSALDWLEDSDPPHSGLVREIAQALLSTRAAAKQVQRIFLIANPM